LSISIIYCNYHQQKEPFIVQFPQIAIIYKLSIAIIYYM